jgi:hypothetical protein
LGDRLPCKQEVAGSSPAPPNPRLIERIDEALAERTMGVRTTKLIDQRLAPRRGV